MAIVQDERLFFRTRAKSFWRTIDEVSVTTSDAREARRGEEGQRGSGEPKRDVCHVHIAEETSRTRRGKATEPLTRRDAPSRAVGFFRRCGTTKRRGQIVRFSRASARWQVRGDSWKRRVVAETPRRGSFGPVERRTTDVATRFEPRTTSASRSRRRIAHTHLVLLLVLLGLGVLHLLEGTLEHLHALVDLLHRPVDLRLELATVRHLDRGCAPSVAVPAPSA